MRRRGWLKRSGWLLGSTLVGACGPGGRSQAQKSSTPVPGPIRPPTGQANALALTVDPSAAGVPVNRRILGQNFHWVFKGDEMLDATGRVRPVMRDLAARLGSTVLRYPGGLQSDTYRWARGLGLQTERGLNEHANARSHQPTVAGTQEFLELCESLGAEPLITVNLASAQATEAAEWVRLVNVKRLVSRSTGRALPRVLWWELGNEPYLRPDEQPGLWMSPAEFGRRARAFAKAMRAVDPGIELCLPLTTDQRSGFPATPMPGFTREVARTPIEGVKLVSLHNAYLPFGMERSHEPDALYWGGMGAGRALAADLAEMRSLLAGLQPGWHPQFALTEYNAMFTLGRDTDKLTLSPAGGLVVAELLHQMVLTPDVALANFWSLSANSFFGAIQQGGWLRPAGQVLSLFSEGLVGQRLPCDLSAPTVSTPAVGYCQPVPDLPVAQALALREGHTLRLIVLHKDPANPAWLSLALNGREVVSGKVSLLRGGNLFDVRDQEGVMQRNEGDWPASSRLSLPPASLALITLKMKP